MLNSLFYCKFNGKMKRILGKLADMEVSSVLYRALVVFTFLLIVMTYVVKCSINSERTSDIVALDSCVAERLVFME